MVQQEEWRPIPGFPHYLASSEGRIRSTYRWRGESGRLLEGWWSKGGYRFVILCGPEGKVRRSVHGLVALAFHGPRPERLQIRHLDSNQRNNAASNLRYGTASENAQDKLNNATHCRRGHPYDQINTRIEPNGFRECRTCRRAAVRQYRERKMLRAAGVRSERAA